MKPFISPLPVPLLLPLLNTAQANPLSIPSISPTSTTTAKNGVSPQFFSSLERLSRLVDISYCVGTPGTGGLSPPFSCSSRCGDVDISGRLELIKSWNTGFLSMEDSCGYVAFDHPPPPLLQHQQTSGKGNIVVAFRGTYSLVNTIVDLSTVPQEYVPYPAGPGGGGGDGNDGGKKGPKCHNCTVHMGFMASWKAAREIVLPMVEKARKKHPDYGVELVGHSLGGAVAMLAGLEMRAGLGWTETRVTTFGEPMVGNKGLVEFVDEVFGLKDEKTNGEGREYKRVTHRGDPVPLLPLREWGFRSHAGEVFITKGDLPPGPRDLRVCEGDRDRGCLNGEDGDEENEADEGWFGEMVRELRGKEDDELWERDAGWPTRFKLWQLLFAHRDYLWRLGLCVPGSDPIDWGRGRYNVSEGDDGMRDL
ncbi:putative lipase [Triangularia setosa]|uniref:Lipase n=1 Tax=Triangularia setosa TaxID=2587417 RepID=A0AAN6W6F4_9PEZI|nr:putative lipase [Podospora setosa]